MMLAIEMEMPERCLIGERFGRLVVVECAGQRRLPCGTSYTAWRCKCDCGNETIVSTSCLTREKNNTRSCGCLKKINNGMRKHGLSHSRIDNVYKNMIKRCYDPKCEKYRTYGARGIKVCDEWINKENGKMNFFEWAFSNGYTEDLTLDRIDVNGDYCPENCRWADKSVQAFNKQKANSKTGARGVFYKERLKMYESYISRNGKHIYLGIYSNIEDAIKARKAAELKYYGQTMD